MSSGDVAADGVGPQLQVVETGLEVVGAGLEVRGAVEMGLEAQVTERCERRRLVWSEMCEKCAQWYHAACVGLDADELLVCNEWFCKQPNCTK